MQGKIMTHEKEIIRWANCPDGTPGWYKTKYTDWAKTTNPLWSIKTIYILDDGWAKIRKAYTDGKTIEYYVGRHKWQEIANPCWDDNIERYRIKPEPVYEWQWVWEDKSGVFHITNRYYTNRTKAAESICPEDRMFRLDKSKRERCEGR